MAEGELDGEVELGHGAVECWEIEEGVEAETGGAARGGEDFSVYGAVGFGEDFCVAGCDEDAAVTGGAGIRGLGEGVEEAEVVADVWIERSGVRRALEVHVFCVAGGADTGGKVEGVDFEAGVVGQDDLAGCVGSVVEGLEAGVAGEGGLVFFWGGDVLEVGQGGEGDAGGGGGGEVAELAGV